MFKANHRVLVAFLVRYLQLEMEDDMRNLFYTSLLAGALALASPSGALAHGVARQSAVSRGSHSMSMGSHRNAPSVGQAVPRGGAAAAPQHGYIHGQPWGPGYRFYPGFGFGLGYSYYDPFWYGPGWAYPGYAYPYVAPDGVTGGLRLEVTPKTAQVYVDGAYAGVVDDFNGHFQHLDLTPGGHRIEVRQPGFQTLTIEPYIQPDHTTDFKGALTPDTVQ
jgi:hypothetical protein